MKNFAKPNSTLTFTSKHLRAEKYKQLCLISDEIVLSNADNIGQLVFHGYEVVAKEYEHKTNFKAVAYGKNNEIVVCFVGTDSKCLKDHFANFKMGIGKITEQMKLAEKFQKQIIDKFQGFEIIVAGHSEGGSEAQYVGLSYGLQTYTYNTFAISKSIIAKAIKNNNGQNFDYLINNYRDSQDPISKLFYKDIGNTYIVENSKLVFIMKMPLGRKVAHSLKNMGDCTAAIPIAVYKKEHPFFVNKVGKVGLVKLN